jgi:AcrR family transcriptional regulator
VSEPVAPTVLRRDAAANRARLVDAAERVFAELGTAAGMDDIARAAGVGPATLYRRFATKDELVRAVLERFFARLLALADIALEAPAKESLQLFFLTVGSEIASQRGLAHRLWGELAPTELVLELERKTRALVERARTGGAIAPTVTVYDVATAVRAMRGAIESDDDAWRRHIAFVLAGFRVGPEPGILSEHE